MFLGIYKTFFTGKNRVVLPKRFRSELGKGEKFYLVKGINGEIWGFNEEIWLREARKRLEMPIDDAQGRATRRKFFPQADECLLDSQGRFILPDNLVRYAVINNEILLVGLGDYFEIWSPGNFKDFSKQ